MKTKPYDAFLVTIFKRLRFHLSTPETKRFENYVFSKGSTFESFRFHHRFRIVDDRPKRTKKYAKHISVVGALVKMTSFSHVQFTPLEQDTFIWMRKIVTWRHRGTSDWLKLARKIKARNNQSGPFHKSLISYVITMELFG